MALRIVATLAAGLALCATARADNRDVAHELRALADRAAYYASPAGLAPLVEERVAASDVAGLAAVIANRRRGPSMGAVDDGWLAAAYGAAGERADLERAATRVEAALAKQTKYPLADSARCGVAIGFEYLRDAAAADTWRKQAAAGEWCHERLPVVAARLGNHDRAAALLAEETLPSQRVQIMIALAEVYTGTAEKARVAPLLEEAAKLVANPSSSMIEPVRMWPKLAVRWAAIGNKQAAKAAAARALALFDEQAHDEAAMAIVFGDDVAQGLAAAGDTRALARLVKRLEKARANDDRFVARLQNARIVAKYGPRTRGKALIAKVVKELEGDGNTGVSDFAARFALIDSYLALGDLPAAIEEAGSTSATQPVEIEALIKIARHCRERGCKRTASVSRKLAAVSAYLDKLEATQK